MVLTKFRLKIDLGSVSASILPSWGCFWELLGAFGRPLGLPWATLGRSRGALGGSWGFPGLPRDSLGTHLGPSWAPWASRGGSGRVLASQNHEKSINFGRFLHQFSVPKSVANLVVCAPMLVPKSLSKRVWPSILDRWLRRFGGCFSILGGIEIRRRQRRGGWEHRRHNTMSRWRRQRRGGWHQRRHNTMRRGVSRVSNLVLYIIY